MNFSIYDEHGSMKSEIKIGMAIDDYKIKNKAEWWTKCLKHVPEVERHYNLIKEEVGPGVTKNTMMIYRLYKLKTEKNK